MEEDKSIFFQKIDDCLLDERKVVTYKWLSQFLGVHVNQAKRLLLEYSEALEPFLRRRLEVTYAIGGRLKGGMGFSFQVVKEEDLQKAKEFFSVITSEHIYSLEMMPLPDLSALFTVDRVEGDSSKKVQSAVTCKNSVQRSPEEKFARRQEVHKYVAGPSTSGTFFIPMDVDLPPEETSNRTPSPVLGTSKSAPTEKRPKLAENIVPKAKDLEVPKPKPDTQAPAKTGMAKSTSSTSTGRGKAGPSAAAKGKKSKKIFGSTPGRRKQTSLTAFFKKA